MSVKPKRANRKRTVKASQCSILAMCDGRGEKTHSTVIQDGRKMHYVGIGWVDEGPATKEDLKKYPTVE